MNLIEVALQVPTEYSEIMVAELAQFGYDSFEETESGLNAYCKAEVFSEEELGDLHTRYQDLFTFEYSFQEIEQQNWNAEWEKNFPALIIADQVSVRASFHPRPENVKHDIVINPKMSFGTGHHDTTSLMLQFQLEISHEGKRVLDMGCGTGILAIMACKLGAAKVVAIDIEDWTAENAKENALTNACPQIDVRQGDITALPTGMHFDIILANINRNVLLADMKQYADVLVPGGTLLLSGFYEEDIPVLLQTAQKLGFRHRLSRVQNQWASLHLVK
jgi:ribosomal protein L11 methyltransferase